jgi:hypothetical protein
VSVTWMIQNIKNPHPLILISPHESKNSSEEVNQTLLNKIIAIMWKGLETEKEINNVRLKWQV